MTHRQFQPLGPTPFLSPKLIIFTMISILCSVLGKDILIIIIITVTGITNNVTLIVL